MKSEDIVTGIDVYPPSFGQEKERTASPILSVINYYGILVKKALEKKEASYVLWPVFMNGLIALEKCPSMLKKNIAGILPKATKLFWELYQTLPDRGKRCSILLKF